MTTICSRRSLMIGSAYHDFCICTHYKIVVEVVEAITAAVCARERGLSALEANTAAATKDFTHFLWVSLDI